MSVIVFIPVQNDRQRNLESQESSKKSPAILVHEITPYRSVGAQLHGKRTRSESNLFWQVQQRNLVRHTALHRYRPHQYVMHNDVRKPSLQWLCPRVR